MTQTFGAHLLVGGYRIDHKVLSSIQDASRKTGVSFSFLMAQAGRESAFNAQAANRRSSASGLYQFTSGTWLELMKKHGPDHGHGDLAAAIKVSGDGDYEVADAGLRKRILDMRREPGLAAIMAGEYANTNRAILEEKLGRQAGATDLYLAHFLGPNGAVRFLKALDANPRLPAANFVPTAAEVNPRVFYHGGRPASLATVYGRIRGTLESQSQYTHLEEVPAWKAVWTENISVRPQFAALRDGSGEESPVEDWVQAAVDDIEPTVSPIDPFIQEAADEIERTLRPTRAPTAIAMTNAMPSVEPSGINPAMAARRLAEAARLVNPAAAATAGNDDIQQSEDPGKPQAVGFKTLWRSLVGRDEV